MSKSEQKEVFKWILLTLGFVLISSTLILYFGERCMKYCCVLKFLCIFMIIGLIACIIAIMCCNPDSEQNCEPLCLCSENIVVNSDKGISIVYNEKEAKSKICYAKFYNESDLDKLLKHLDKNEKIYISKNTKLDKTFFEKIREYNYEIIIQNNSASIEITK